MTEEWEPQLVADAAATRDKRCVILEQDGDRIRFAATRAGAKRQLEAAYVSLVLLDRRLPDGII